MTKKILSYQTNAVNTCIEHLQDNKEFKLQSPTGSGKTFIISQIIDKYLENDYLNSCPTTFIFVAPSTGSLDYQGYEKITSYLNKDWAKGYTTEYIGTSKQKSSSKSYLSNIDYFKPNTCYFFGWQMFKKGTRITEIDSERNDIYKVISNTKMKDINIVLIIDEAHREVTSSKDDINTKQIIINDLDPFKIIKVSATLEQKGEKPDCIITYDDVREEAAIKENVIISQINEKVSDIDKYNEEEQLIISAIEKQKEVKQQYVKHKIDINPLILIQIPDKVTIDKEITSEDLLLKRIESILDKQGFKKGWDYSIWLSDDKTIKNKEELVKNDSSIEILIFKTAIATGWDIPRANILVRIREAKTKAFNIQTLGRILRNPFFKYYNNDLIDNAFVYTRDEKYKEYIKEEKIVSDEKEIVKLKRSPIAKNSTFSLNKILITHKNNYDEEEMIKTVASQIISDKQFVNNFFKYEKENVILGPIRKKAADILQKGSDSLINKDIENQKQKNITQSRLNIYKPKITLFDLYIKFRTITKSSPLIERIINEITLSLKQINKKIKEFYWSCCYNWNKNIFKTDNNIFITLKDLIEKLKDQYLSKYIEYKQEIYELPKEYNVSTKKFDPNKWDELNTFEGSLKIKEGLDSDNERIFYKSIKNKDLENIHIFRNGTNPQNDYYIEYIDKNDSKIRKFFPDFILINEKNKQCIVLEAKGNKNDIDPNSKSKFQQFIRCLKRNEIKNNYQCKNIIKVYENNEEPEYINKEKEELISWKEIRKILEI